MTTETRMWMRLIFTENTGVTGFDGVIRSVRAVRLMAHADVKNLNQNLIANSNVIDARSRFAAKAAVPSEALSLAA